MLTEMRAVPDLPDYFAASDGTVWRMKGDSLTPVKAHRLKNGYLAVNARRGPGDWATLYVHRLVAAAWLGPPPDGAVTRHLNGNPDDNAPDNLRWGTHGDNTQDRIRHGRSLAGVRSPHAKLTPWVAFAIREAVKMGLTRRAVADHFGLAPSTVGEMAAGRRWADPPDATLAC